MPESETEDRATVSAPNENNEESEDEQNEDAEQEQYYGDLIEKNHLELVNSIDLQRQLLFSYLRSKLVLDEEDCERILNTGTTRQQKASIFLDVIKRKGAEGMKHFMDALQFENPALYTRITGKQPTANEKESTTIPYVKTTSWSGELLGKDYIDFDRMVLAKQLEQTANEYHKVIRIHQKVQEEKNILEKKLYESEKNAKIQQQYVEELKSAIEKFSEIKRLSDEDNMAGHEMQSQFQRDIAVQQAVIGKTYHIMALQGKLLALTEDLELFRKENADYKDKNDKLNKKVMDLAIKFDAERRQSRRLNEQVLNHSENCKNEKQDLREVKLLLAIKKEENERLRDDLDELTKFSEILNVKFKLMLHEKNKLKEQSEDITFSFQDARDQVHDLSCKFNSIQVDKKYLQQRNERLLADNSRHREMQKNYLDELELSRSECQKAWKSMEEARSEATSVKKMHDEVMHSQLIINRQLEEKYDDVVDQLDAMRNCLEQTKEELVHAQKNNRRLNTALQNQTSPNNHCDQDVEKGLGEVDTEIKKESNLPAKEPSFRLSRHVRKELIESLKRKAVHSCEQSPSCGGGGMIASSSTSTPSQSSSSKSLSRLTYEQIEIAFPAVSCATTIPSTGALLSLQPPARTSSKSCAPRLDSRSRSLDYSEVMLPTSPVSFMTKIDVFNNNTCSSKSNPSSFDLQKSASTITTTTPTTANLNLPRVVSDLSLQPTSRYLQGRRALSMGKKNISLDNGGGGKRQDDEDEEEDFLGHSFSSLPPNLGDCSRISNPEKWRSSFHMSPTSPATSLSSTAFQERQQSVISDDDSSSIFGVDESLLTESSQSINIGDWYLAHAIKESPQLDFPPSKIHSIRSSPIFEMSEKARRASTPVDVSRFRLSSPSDFDCSRSDLSLAGEDETNKFRKRSGKHVDADEKSKWERRRSLSLPTSKYSFDVMTPPFHGNVIFESSQF